MLGLFAGGNLLGKFWEHINCSKDRLGNFQCGHEFAQFW